MIRMGLCCQFIREPIRFRRTTVKSISSLSPGKRLLKLSELCLHNAGSLFQALKFCAANGIGCFRITSQILPLKTHPQYGYQVRHLPSGSKIIRCLKECGVFAAHHNLRLTFHPDQFVVLNPINSDIFKRSLEELKYHAQVAGWTGVDIINIHAGGGYGDKQESLRRLEVNIRKLPENILSRLTLENDDRLFTPKDLIPVCKRLGIPFVYDVFHHRNLPDGLTVGDATSAALETWNREPLFHLSSPSPQGLKGYHSDYIRKNDFPKCWRRLDVTVEVEAKAKELAVLKLKRELNLADQVREITSL
ncbi:MAG: UV DNA damage repair endonuclease UvsE [Candidatus Omnitrophota bacterium]